MPQDAAPDQAVRPEEAAHDQTVPEQAGPGPSLSEQAMPEPAMTEPALPQQQGDGAPKGLLQQMEELMAALTADLSQLDADLQSSGDRGPGDA
ncbi:hypothetical protein [Streptomyces sp. NPDC005408]|uniref:hypothetical protein n=1 Tax=Streptomyces sp. NPDC005408 TaxID=3155341 RepID=UPI0033A6E6D3